MREPIREITSHKVNGCNEAIKIEASLPVDGVPTRYYVRVGTRGGGESGISLDFQNGPTGEVGTNGVTHEALIAVVVDRLQSFQRGRSSCRENALALTHLEEAMHWLEHRTRGRLARIAVEASKASCDPAVLAAAEAAAD